MAEKTVVSFGNALELANLLLHCADDTLEASELVAEALSHSTEDSGRQTVSGLMNMRVLARDRNGNELSFPISLVINTTFSLNQATPLDKGAEAKRKQRLRRLIPDSVWSRQNCDT